MKKGLLIVFSGPSGVGKGTILKDLMKVEELKLSYSVSMTTRKPREGEVEGVNYYYVSEERFKEAIANDELLEYAQFVGNYYGTPKANVEMQRELGNNVVLEIEVVGAKQVLERNRDAISIFIVPPSIEELERRIRGRNTETEEVIQLRVNKAKEELRESNMYQYVVCNDGVSRTIEILKDIILKEMRK